VSNAGQRRLDREIIGLLDGYFRAAIKLALFTVLGKTWLAKSYVLSLSTRASAFFRFTDIET